MDREHTWHGWHGCYRRGGRGPGESEEMKYCGQIKESGLHLDTDAWGGSHSLRRNPVPDTNGGQTGVRFPLGAAAWGLTEEYRGYRRVEGTSLGDQTWTIQFSFTNQDNYVIRFLFKQNIWGAQNCLTVVLRWTVKQDCLTESIKRTQQGKWSPAFRVQWLPMCIYLFFFLS